MRNLLAACIIVLTFLITAFLLWRKRTFNALRIPAHLDSYWDTQKERRKFVRFSKKLPVSLTFAEKTQSIYHIFSKNISGEGICLQVPEILPEGSILDLKIDIPGLNHPIQARGEVVWLKEEGPAGIQQKAAKRIFNAGIKFLKLGIRERQYLYKYLQAISKDEKEG